MTKVFVGHKKNCDNERLLKIRENLRRQASGPMHIVLGREDYQAVFQNAGSWDRWEQSVATRYDLIILPDAEGIGNATAQIVAKAIQAGKKVLFTPDGLSFQQPSGMEVESKEKGKRFRTFYLLGIEAQSEETNP